jgi:hypothetical protein
MIEILHMTLGLDEVLAARCDGWVQRFAQIVAQSPIQVPCDVRRVEGALRGRLEATFGAENVASITSLAWNVFLDCERWAIRDGGRAPLPRLVVICQPSNPLAAKVQVTNPGALWGASNGSLAIIYHHEPTVIWHEMFHLLGADDCYEGESAEDSALPTCGHPNCIMQYAPSVAVVGDPPFICDTNVQLIRKRWAENSTMASYQTRETHTAP